MKAEKVLCQICSFLVSIAPLVIIFALNWNKYTATPVDTVNLCLGGTICAIFVFMKAVGKLHMPKRVVLFGVMCVLSYLLQKVLDDLLIISAMAFLGEVIDCLIFQKLIRSLDEKIHITKTADATSTQVKELFETYIGKGRV